MAFGRRKLELIGPDEALPGRSGYPFTVPETHHVNGNPIRPPFPDHLEQLTVGMGCFWGAERIFWNLDGVWTTAVGYAGGYTPHPTYEEVCSGRTGHTEAVLVVYDPDQVSLDTLFAAFWENHDPTQEMRQGNDVGTQYRSAVYTHTDAQLDAAKRSRDAYQAQLSANGYGDIATEITPAGPFWWAEDHHQQYLAKNPMGYCNHGFCQVRYDPPS